jgi:hypothetical protein
MFIVILNLLILSFYYNLKLYLIELGHKRWKNSTRMKWKKGQKWKKKWGAMNSEAAGENLSS